MTKDASFKKVVRRHAEETGQRYTEALTDLQGLGARMHHGPVPDRLLVHLRDRYGIDPVAATKLSVHKTYVFRIDRKDGDPWVARAFPPGRRPARAGDRICLHGYFGICVQPLVCDVAGPVRGRAGGARQAGRKRGSSARLRRRRTRSPVNGPRRLG